MLKMILRSTTILLILAFSASVAGAQDAEGCALPPVTLPLFDATPAADLAATPAPATPGDIDEAEIREAVEVIVDCINSGDPAYQYAIFTDHYLAVQFADTSQTNQPEFEQRLAQGGLENEAIFTLVDVPTVSVQSNGLVSATIVLSNGGQEFSDTVLLANIDGDWLIDSVEQFDPER